MCLSLTRVKHQRPVLHCGDFFFFPPMVKSLHFLWTLSQINWYWMCEHTEGELQNPSAKINDLKLIYIFRSLRSQWLHILFWHINVCYMRSNHMKSNIQLTLLWWIEARFQAVEELIKTQLPVSVLVRQLDEGIDTQAPGGHMQTCKHRLNN